MDWQRPLSAFVVGDTALMGDGLIVWLGMRFVGLTMLGIGIEAAASLLSIVEAAIGTGVGAGTVIGGAEVVALVATGIGGMAIGALILGSANITDGAGGSIVETLGLGLAALKVEGCAAEIRLGAAIRYPAVTTKAATRAPPMIATGTVRRACTGRIGGNRPNRSSAIVAVRSARRNARPLHNARFCARFSDRTGSGTRFNSAARGVSSPLYGCFPVISS